MKFYQQSNVTGNLIKTDPRIEVTFGFTAAIEDLEMLEELQSYIVDFLTSHDLKGVSNTRKIFLNRGLSKAVSQEITFVDKNSIGSSLMV